MHVISKKDQSKAELETVTISKNPIWVVTAIGEKKPRYTPVNWTYS